MGVGVDVEITSDKMLVRTKDEAVAVNSNPWDNVGSDAASPRRPASRRRKARS
jgi:hypothetical protein